MESIKKPEAVISKSAYRRMARRAGVKRICTLSYSEMDMILRQTLKDMLEHSIIILESHQKKTLTAEHVLIYLRSANKTIYI